MNNLISLCKNSAFNKSSSNFTVSFRTIFLHRSLEMFTDYYDNNKSANPISYATPEFQRTNDKWTSKQKSQLIENIMKGYRTNIMLFRMNESDDAKIIDGLQRLTAIYEFHNNQVTAFGLKISEIDDLTLRRIGGNIDFSVYTFDKWEEVGRFYIEMNEGITHSEKDIQKCKDWFLNEKGIKL